MKRKHNRYSPEFKAKVAKAALKEEATLSELSQLYQVPINQISKWKNQALQDMYQIFQRNKKSSQDKEQEKLISRLYQQIGKLQVEQEWLKKTLDL